MSNAAAPSAGKADWRLRPGSVLWLAFGVTVARALYLAFLCPYTLVEDEAHYWEWSRRLEWSYYSKGPGVAWVIAASDWLFGKLGVATSEFTVRMPSVAAGLVLMLVVAALAREATGEKRAGWYAAVALVLAPVFYFGSLLMTIDVPYAACWACAALAGWRAMNGSRWAWVGLGAALGAGFLFKYTILLLVPGLVVFAVVRRGRLGLARGWGLWAVAGLIVFALGLAPVVIWNAEHGWPTFKHLLGHLGLAGGDVTPTQGTREGWKYDPRWTLELIGTQLPLIGPVMIVAVLSMVRAIRSRREDAAAWAGQLYLMLCAAPIFLFYLAVSFVAEPEGNWPLAGHLTLLALAGWGAPAVVSDWKRKVAEWRALPEPRPWRGFLTRRPETLARLAWRLAVVVGVIVAAASLRADLIAVSPPMKLVEWALRRVGIVKTDRPLVPVGRLTGAGTMALDAERLRAALSAETGKDAFVIAQQYGRASLLAFYMPGRPTVYCSSAVSPWGRRTQYDMWDSTSLEDPGLMGRPAVLVGGRRDDWGAAFQEVREQGPLNGETKKDRVTFLGIGYRGFGGSGAAR